MHYYCLVFDFMNQSTYSHYLLLCSYPQALHSSYHQLYSYFHLPHWRFLLFDLIILEEYWGCLKSWHYLKKQHWNYHLFDYYLHILYSHCRIFHCFCHLSNSSCLNTCYFIRWWCCRNLSLHSNCQLLKICHLRGCYYFRRSHSGLQWLNFHFLKDNCYFLW